MNANAQDASKNPNKWIWIGLGVALFLCCCAAAAAILVFGGIGRSIQEGMTTDPQSISKTLREMVDYDLPDGYQERLGMDFGFYTIAMIGPVSYVSDEPLILFAQFSGFGMSQEQMEQQLRQSFEQQSGRRGLEMRLVDVRQMTIRGNETDVAIYEGADDSGVAMRQLIASFPGKEGTVILMVMGDPSAWDAQVIDDFILSIR